MSSRIWLAGVLALMVFTARESPAQSAFYTFTSGPGGDGFVWDYDEPPSGLNDLPDGELFTTPDDVELYNYTGNTNFFDTAYGVAGNSSLIDGEAWWGNPTDSFAYTEINLESTINGSVQSLSFDFAWSMAGSDTPDFLPIFVTDSAGLETIVSPSLDNTFSGFDGVLFDSWEGHITLDAADLTDDGSGDPFADISLIEIYVEDIATGGPSSVFAIDNLSLTGGPGDPSDSNIFPAGSGGGQLFGIGTNRLKGYFDTTAVFDVMNDGAGDTTFSITIEPGSDPEYVPGTLPSGEPVAIGQTVSSGPLATVNSDLPSGQYTAQFRVHNDLNSGDADELVDYSVEIIDPPDLSDDSGAVVQVDQDAELFIANAAAGPHVGALRAGVEVTARTLSGAGFSVSGLEVEEFVFAGETDTATVAFNRYGRLNGTYIGTFSVDLEMNSAPGGHLNGAQPVPSVVWNVEYDLSDQLADSVAVASTETFGPNKIGVNDVDTAATLLGGEASSAQTVDMQLVANPEAGGDRSALILGSVVDLEFTTPGDLYVMQMTYDEANLPIGFSENGLLPMFYDELAGRWVFAMDTNSDGGAGAVFHTTSFDDFLAGLGGSPLPLSAFGLDTANDQLWAILDHASLFGVGTPFLEGDMNGNGFLDAEDIQLFVQALTDRAGYDAQGYNVNADIVGDMDGSGALDLGDVGPFRALLASSAGAEATAVPEPASTLLVLCVAVGACCGGRPLRHLASNSLAGRCASSRFEIHHDETLARRG